MTVDSFMKRYPKRVRAGDVSVTLRMLAPDDRAGLEAFARTLSEEDMLFLRNDITDPATLDAWIASIGGDRVATILALANDRVVGYALLSREPARWTRNVGEVRVNMAKEFRGGGLGRTLIAEIFDYARSLGLRKVMAHVTAEQRGAQSALRSLGFMAEALLSDFVVDRAGRSHDLIVMTFDVDGLGGQSDVPVRVD
jgi:L-amino acid N-acyltransferase YncA